MQEEALPRTNLVLLHILSAVLNIIYRLYFRVTFHRNRATLAALKNTGRPVIIVFNHTSHLDVPAVGLCLGVGLFRRLIMPGKKELFEHPAMAWFLRQLGVVPVDRNINDMRVVRMLMCALQQGYMIILAPEGTRSQDGALQPFKAGFIKLAHRSNALVVPIGIRGAYAAFPRGTRFPRPHKVSVHMGAPIDLCAALPVHPTADVYAKTAETIREQMQELCGA